MADHQHHLIQNHHHHHRPNRISLPQRNTTTTTTAGNPNTPNTSRLYPVYPFTPSSSSSTPSKHRLSSLPSFTSNSKPTTKSSLSFLFLLLLFSLRSLYSLLPFLRSSPPSFSLFPFSFLVSLLSFLLTLAFSLLPSTPSSLKNPFHPKPQNQIFLSLSSISQSQLRALFFKSILLAVVFLLRFQALRYCGTAALILAELSGNVTARFAFESRDQNFGGGFGQNRISKVRGFLALFFGLFLLAVSWDRIECFPLSAYSVEKFGVSVFPRDNCVRFWPMLLPFVSGFLGCYDRVSMNSGTIRQLGQKRVRLISLFFTTIVLFVPAVISVVVFEAEGDSVSFGNLIWPLANTVVFGVLLSENYSDEKLASSKDFRREFLVTFLCTLVLELFYFAELSLWGLLLCGLLLYVAVRELDPVYLNYLELGMESPESFSTSIMKPIRHILSERKSRKIALFLLINTGYMVVEFVAGFMSNSLGLISDACHMLFDCAALAIGLYASYISRLPANNQYNYGRGRFEVLSGYVNAVFLVLVGALIVLESFERILDPQEISTNSLLTVSIGGLVVNVVGLIFFHEEHHHAHGGCSQSHPHSHSHSHTHHHDQHSHDHTGHHHEDHGNHHECITVSHECHEKSCSDHGDHHEHHSCNTHGGADSCKDHISGGHDHHHDHAHQHDQHDHAHHHDHHHHDHQHHHHQADDDHVPDVHHRHHHSDGHNVADSHGQGAGSQAHANSTKLSSGRDQPQKHHHHHIDHNMEGIFLHVLADTMGSVGVVISTLLIKYKGWLVADPACSIFISVLIVASVIPLLRNSAEVLLQRVPRMHEQELKEALNDVMKIRGICGIQNFHVWSFTNTDVVGTLNLHISAETDKASTKAHVSRILNDAGIKDLTLQVECVG
ncbi:zinc transporter 5 [Quercus lobata]|uniref:Cation efflux protein transmembrane domain-containing protein n=1 Tax=Quercus lobata TaxID=97700 RepID=A0A7N2KZT3_QUELO|nr:zinc transporter 5 [Quercus lobata]